VPIGKDATPLKGQGSHILSNDSYGKVVYLRLSKHHKWQGKTLVGLTPNPHEATRFTQSGAFRAMGQASRVISRQFTIVKAVAAE
jgi:hypothetical protein